MSAVWGPLNPDDWKESYLTLFLQEHFSRTNEPVSMDLIVGTYSHDHWVYDTKITGITRDGWVQAWQNLNKAEGLLIIHMSQILGFTASEETLFIGIT